jgi:RNA-binding protein YhbY
MRLKVATYGVFRFVTNVNENGTIQSLFPQLEKEIEDLYQIKVKVLWMKDEEQNDLYEKKLVKDLLKDKDQVYIFVFPAESNERQIIQ